MPPFDPLPNIVLILADDLGYGELGSYGQNKIHTPNLDRLAAQGMRFTQSYAGSPVCEPSRCVLLTGLHTRHAAIRDNDEVASRGDVWHDPALEGQRPLPAGTVTLAEILHEAGYRTAAIGKWGPGWDGSIGEPMACGFDHFLGYLCQRQAHNYYPDHLWKDGEKLPLRNRPFFPRQRLAKGTDPSDPSPYARFRGEEYAPDRMIEDALAFIRKNRDRPFFLYYPSTLPHVALQIPEADLDEYEGAFPETPYRGSAGYLPNRTPRATYAGMISRLDREVGRIMAELDTQGTTDQTLLLFTSDNGPTWVGGVDWKFFHSRGGLRGRKAQLYEGGIRVPLIARWPGHIPPGSVTGQIGAFWDFLPTLSAVAPGSALALLGVRPQDASGTAR